MRIPNFIEDDDCEDLELASNPVFIQAMESLVKFLESGEFNLDEVKTQPQLRIFKNEDSND